MASTVRLTFLYPHLLRAGMRASGGRARAMGELSSSTAAARRWKSFAPRHGKGIEPKRFDDAPPQDQQQSSTEQPPSTPPSAILEAEQNPSETSVVHIGETYGNDAGTSSSELDIQAAASSQTTAQANASESSGSASAADDATDESHSKDEQSESDKDAQAAAKEAEEREERARQTREEAKQSGPLEAVLHMQAPEQVARQHPAMSPPPYVHHFDSYSLVKQLQEGGYTQDHSITVMKGVRMLLAQNLDVAQESLVSKSDVENETYLFRAACSELSTEIKNNRRLQDEQMRQQRSHLQYEVDILTQSLNQELLTLNDNVKGLFNDRRMAVREQQKGVESGVQQANYKISIMLSSDAKSEIEGVRWVLIRRSVLGIIIMAILTLGTLRYATFVTHERQKEAERRAKQEEDLRKNGMRRETKTLEEAEAAEAVLAATGAGS